MATIGTTVSSCQLGAGEHSALAHGRILVHLFDQPRNPPINVTRSLSDASPGSRRAAELANEAMRVQSFADRRPDRFPWCDREWQWASLHYEGGDFNTATRTDLEARDKWFYHAIGASPAMFRRDEQAGSLYWLGLMAKDGAYLDGGKSYRLAVPVPGKLFWSMTVYGIDTRGQIQTDQNKAALCPMFDLKDVSCDTAELFFGPEAPTGKEGQWIKTIPGEGWFVYFASMGRKGRPPTGVGSRGFRAGLKSGRSSFPISSALT